MKKFRRLIALCVALVSICSVAAGCRNGDGGYDIDETQNQIYVFNFAGGVGTEWLYAIEEEFEKQYVNYEYDGKTGIDVIITAQKDIMTTGLKTKRHQVIFTETVPVNELASQGELADITDIVKEQTLADVSNGVETCTIESKFSEAQKAALTAINNKYYVVPHYEVYAGVTYDRKVFDDYSLFFKDGGGWTDLSDPSLLSVGPDGVRGTYDDGMPSSYEEFYALCDHMLSVSVEPIIYASGLKHYTQHLLMGMYGALAGLDEAMLYSNYGEDSFVTEPVTSTIVTGFEGGVPVTERVEINKNNSYLAYSQLARYQAYKAFWEILNDDNMYISQKASATLRNTPAQDEFIYSDLENEPIGMLIEGSYWYEEAQATFLKTENQYKDRAKNRNFAWMPFPSQYYGTVTEGNGRKGTLIDSDSSFAFINGNISENPVELHLAKLFLKYCYQDTMLELFTAKTGIAKGVDYEISNETLNSIPPFSRSLWQTREQCDIVHPISDSPMFVQRPTYMLGGTIFSASIGTEYFQYPITAFDRGYTAEQYFQGGEYTANQWKDLFGDLID